MGYLQMQLMNETTETSTIGICLNIDKFYADLDLSLIHILPKLLVHGLQRQSLKQTAMGQLITSQN